MHHFLKTLPKQQRACVDGNVFNARILSFGWTHELVKRTCAT